MTKETTSMPPTWTNRENFLKEIPVGSIVSNTNITYPDGTHPTAITAAGGIYSNETSRVNVTKLNGTDSHDWWISCDVTLQPTTVLQ